MRTWIWQPWAVVVVMVGIGMWFMSWFDMSWPARMVMYTAAWIVYYLGVNRGEHRVIDKPLVELIRDGTIDAAKIPIQTRVGDRVIVKVERMSSGGEWYTAYEDTRVR